MAKNRVIAGEYKDSYIGYTSGKAYIYFEKKENIYLDKQVVKSYNVINENYKKNVGGVVGRAAVGAALLGPVGLLAGITAKNKGTIVVAIEFKSGRQCLLEIDDQRYKAIVTQCF